MKRAIRKIHRWLGLLVLAQLLAWMVSGFYFTLYPIEEIRGEHLTRDAATLEPQDLHAADALRPIRESLDEEFGADWTLGSLDVQRSDDRLHWRVEGSAAGEPFRRLLSLDGATILPELSARQASHRAAAWLHSSAEPIAVARVPRGAGEHDLRGWDGPAWKVTFDRPEAFDLYLEPWTGEIIARRTDRWRLFDFMWMLHIMDYATREDFHHPLLQLAAGAGLLVAVSGLLVWLMIRRRRAAPAWRRRVEA